MAMNVSVPVEVLLESRAQSILILWQQIIATSVLPEGKCTCTV